MEQVVMKLETSIFSLLAKYHLYSRISSRAETEPFVCTSGSARNWTEEVISWTYVTATFRKPWHLSLSELGQLEFWKLPADTLTQQKCVSDLLKLLRSKL